MHCVPWSYKRVENNDGKNTLDFREKTSLRGLLEPHYVLALSNQGTLGVTKWKLWHQYLGLVLHSFGSPFVDSWPPLKTHWLLSPCGTQPDFLSLVLSLWGIKGEAMSQSLGQSTEKLRSQAGPARLRTRPPRPRSKELLEPVMSPLFHKEKGPCSCK